jgi:catechol 2,3-dioxygenase-like lactoylglutathione lyase family enzyme
VRESGLPALRPAGRAGKDDTMENPVTFRLDHIVIMVGDLDDTIADYRALGFTVLPGGEHPGRGSRNALVVFADGVYLELISFARPAPDFRWWQAFERDGEGFIDFALLPSDVDAAASAARARGVAVSGPEAGGRQRPDGVAVAWRNARPDGSDLPFLCFDVTPRALRVPEGAVRVHANGATGVTRLTVAVADADRSLTRYGAYVGAEGRALAPTADGLRRAEIVLAGATVELVAPGESGEASEALRRRIERRGEGPLALGLAGKGGPLDPALLHSAAIAF